MKMFEADPAGSLEGGQQQKNLGTSRLLCFSRAPSRIRTNDPLITKWARMTLRLDLTGIDEIGDIQVDNPINSNAQA